MHSMGVPLGKIAERFGITETTVRNGIRRAIAAQYRPEVEEMRIIEDERLNFMMRRLSALLRHPQYKVSVTGKIITDAEGRPLVDTSEERQILLALLKISESRRKLHGADQPVKHRIEITDKLDEEIEKLANELAMQGAGHSPAGAEHVPVPPLAELEEAGG